MYVLENNGVYGLRKASSPQQRSRLESEAGRCQPAAPIDPVLFALNHGANLCRAVVQRRKAQLVPLLKALAHGDLPSWTLHPLRAFNDHEGSTRSYQSMRERAHEVAPVDSSPAPRDHRDGREVEAGGARTVRMHYGSLVRFRALERGLQSTDRDRAYATVQRLQSAGEVATGLLYLDPAARRTRCTPSTPRPRPLVDLPYEGLPRPGAGA